MRKSLRNHSLVAIVIAIGVSILFTAFQSNLFEVTKNLDVLVSVYKQINTYYVDDTQPGEIMKTGIDAMLESLDPYTVYYPESDIEDYKFMTTGQYGGIGSLIHREGEYVVISEPYEGFPAYKAGLIAGDKIIKIDGKDARNKTTEEISKALKGEPQTELILTIERINDEESLDVKVIREEIKIEDVPYSGVLDNNIGYIKLTSFTETASKNVKEAFNNLKEEHDISGVVLDLRGNGGGLLQEAVNIVNIFVPKGQMVVETKGRIEDWNRRHVTSNEPLDTEIPLVVLIDANSASASEIVAGTIQDLDRGVIIGENSFGKGLVQQTRELAYNSMLKMTVAKYYIPSGRCIQRLDYSNKSDDGRAQEVPDSLRQEFQTNNGRKVLDGAGIEPDLTVDVPDASPILRSLLRKRLIFSFVNEFASENDSIAAPEEFEVTDEIYEQFKAFLEDKEYDYQTRTEILLDRLEEAAENEKYYKDVQKEFAKLEEAVSHNKTKDLDTFRDQIERVLSNEIVSRYYYQKGRIRQSLSADEDITEALSVLDEKERYQDILAGSN
ncbi:MAG TPA: peptidase S41 [Flavobacteriales bacterium]|jgi:carboxyl-terminal processing protease|nr:peptidase S41 [Flavobacteriales bacterium]